LLTEKQSPVVPEHDTEPLGEQIAVALQFVGQAGQKVVVPPAVQEPRVPAEQLELVALQVVPVQVRVEPSQQLATQVDLGVMSGRLAASTG
jgi:hypothetical protein